MKCFYFNFNIPQITDTLKALDDFKSKQQKCMK